MNKSHIYHINSKTSGGQYFRAPIPQVWKHALKELDVFYKRHKVDIIAFTLMSNHYHLIIKLSSNQLNKFTHNFHMPQKMIPHFEVIRSKKYLNQCYRYIYQNPLRAKLATRIQDYPYSLIAELARGEMLPFPVCDRLGFNDEYKFYYLNQMTAKENSSQKSRTLRLPIKPSISFP